MEEESESLIENDFMNQKQEDEEILFKKCPICFDKFKNTVLVKIETNKNENKKIDCLSCPICLDKLKSTVSLNCGHNFCGKCLKKSIESPLPIDNDNYVYQICGFSKCPVCRSTFSTDQIQVNILLETLLKNDTTKNFKNFGNVKIDKISITEQEELISAASELIERRHIFEKKLESIRTSENGFKKLFKKIFSC